MCWQQPSKTTRRSCQRPQERKKADAQKVLHDIRAQMRRRGFPQGRPKHIDWANLDAAEVHREALQRYFDAEAERFAVFNSLNDALEKAGKAEITQLRTDDHKKAVVDQVLAFCEHYGREPSVPPRAYTVEDLVIEEVALALRYKGVTRKLSDEQKDQIKEARLGKGDVEIVAALEHLQRYISIGNDYRSTFRIEGDLVLWKKDYDDIRDLLQLRWPPSKATLTPIAQKLGRKCTYTLKRLPEDTDDERADSGAADSKPKAKRTFHYSPERSAYWCRSDALRRVPALCARLNIESPRTVENESVGFETPLTLSALAASLRDENGFLQTPVGDDFLGLQLQSAVLSSHDLLRHFNMMGCDERSFPPAGDKLALRHWRRASSEATLDASLPPGAGLDVDSLAAVLGEAVSVARKKEAHWLKLLIAGKSTTAIDSKAVVGGFLTFLNKRDVPVSTVSKLPRRRVVAILGWYCLVEATEKKQNAWYLGKRQPLSDVLAQCAKKPLHVPAAEVFDGETVHFIQDSSAPFAAPLMTPPRVCQLCGRGFRNNRALHKHYDKVHCGVAEARKRIFWEAEQLPASPLSFSRKRNILGNYDREFRCSRPGGDGELEQREDVACVVCACKDWSEHRYRVFLWQEYVPDGVEAAELPADPGDEDQADTPESETELHAPPAADSRTTAAKLLQDEDGVFYFGDAVAINDFLAVDRYRETMPNIPLAELHASAVQHPAHPEFRWLTQICER